MNLAKTDTMLVYPEAAGLTIAVDVAVIVRNA